MDKYQKRKMRKEKSANKQEEYSDNKMNINWYIPTLINSFLNPYFIRVFI